MTSTTESTLLRALDRLVGSWTTIATHPAAPGVVVEGSVDVEWTEGRHFVLHRATSDHPDFPNSVSMIGLMGTDRVGSEPERSAGLSMHYYDSRGVFREFQVSIDSTAMRLTRMSPGFSQRFTGTFIDDTGIAGLWQLSKDDKTWQDDLKITYQRERSTKRRDPDDYRRIPRKAIKIDLPNATQMTDYTCGASALQAICSYFGVGPEDEWDFEQQMAMPKTGADPIHITTAAKDYGLEVKELRPMTAAQLEKYIDKGRPVILMLQAWAGRELSYARTWDEGHYVIAIGYDDEVFYVEDPSIHGSRGFVTREELDARWHDVEGEDNHHTEHLGIAIWKNKPTKLGYGRGARHVD